VEEIIRDIRKLTASKLISTYKQFIECIDGGGGDKHISMLINDKMIFIGYSNYKMKTLSHKDINTLKIVRIL
jgi:hypothetical protein